MPVTQARLPLDKRWTDPAQARADRDACSASTSHGKCNEVAVAYVVASCAHEHLREGLQCAAHLAGFDGAACATCIGPSMAYPHDCALTLSEVQHREA